MADSGNHVDNYAETMFTQDMTTTKQALPTATFDKIGEVSAAHAVLVSKHPDGSYDICVLHPQGGRIYIHQAATAELAELAQSALNEVLEAWARFSREEG